MAIQKLTITIPVGDLAKAVAYYTELGFAMDWMWPESSPDMASMSSGGISFMLKAVSKERIYPVDLYFTVDHVVDHHAHISKSIATSPLLQQPYGMKDFSITDPYGHQLTWGQPVGDYTPS